MSTKEVAERYSQLIKTNWNSILTELFADNAVSIEPEHALAYGLENADSLEGIKKKGEKFSSMVEKMHGGYCSEPVVGGNFFSVAMGMDVTMKGTGRMNIDEIAIYEVKDGKIIKEQFFY